MFDALTSTVSVPSVTLPCATFTIGLMVCNVHQCASQVHVTLARAHRHRLSVRQPRRYGFFRSRVIWVSIAIDCTPASPMSFFVDIAYAYVPFTKARSARSKQ